MDLQGSLIDTNLKILPSKSLLDFLETLTLSSEFPPNIQQFIKNKNKTDLDKKKKKQSKEISAQLTDKNVEIINLIKDTVVIEEPEVVAENNADKSESKNEIDGKEEKKTGTSKDQSSEKSENDSTKENEEDNKTQKESEEVESPYLLTSDIDWLYSYIKNNKSEKHLHELLQGSVIKTPENKIIKRNPILEARCVKLRAQQEAREYRKMTKSVDNVRINYPEDSIAYQMKQINRQLIAIGQFILSIFAGFLFGFRGVEWMVGNLDFGFRLLLGVMCALIIALAEIYFLAKKLNEELNAVETTQIGGPPKFGDEMKYEAKVVETITDKEHQD